MSKEKAVATVASEEVMEQLKQSYPQEPGALRIMLPRISMVSQDQTEGKGKATKVVVEAGTFFLERQTDEDEVDEETGKLTGRKVWEKLELGKGFEGVILFQRKQLRMYDEATEIYTNSTVYDSDDEIVPLFSEKAEVARGLPKELKAKYMFTNKKGKVVSALEDNRILYVRYEGEIYQLNLRGSSMFSFMTYQRKTIPSTVVTAFSSEAMEKGDIAWNKMTFEAVRPLNAEEAGIILKNVQELQASIAIEKESYAAVRSNDSAKTKELDTFVADAKKAAEAKPPKLAEPGKKKF